MTHKKKYKYRKSKKRGGASLLKGLASAKGLASSKGLAGSKQLASAKELAGSNQLASATKLLGSVPNTSGISGLASATKLLGSVPNTSSISGLANTTKLASSIPDIKGIPKKLPIKSPSPYTMIAEFILNQTTKSLLNFSLASKIFKSPALRKNKYKDQIKKLSPTNKVNFICACKLIYLYYYDEYAHKFLYTIDNSQEIDNMCKIFYIINQQILLYNSSKKKLLSHFNEIFNNNNFSNLYNQNLKKPEYDCNVMKSKIQALFKKDDNDYSYIILDLIFDLFNQSDTIFINIMAELKSNNQTKICDFSKEIQNILENCEEKITYDAGMKLIYPL